MKRLYHHARVLLIDDSPLDRLVVKSLLRRKSPQAIVDYPATPQEVRNCIGASYDLVISDRSMPPAWAEAAEAAIDHYRSQRVPFWEYTCTGDAKWKSRGSDRVIIKNSPHEPTLAEQLNDWIGPSRLTPRTLRRVGLAVVAACLIALLYHFADDSEREQPVVREPPKAKDALYQESQPRMYAIVLPSGRRIEVDKQ